MGSCRELECSEEPSPDAEPARAGGDTHIRLISAGHAAVQLEGPAPDCFAAQPGDEQQTSRKRRARWRPQRCSRAGSKPASKRKRRARQK